MQGNYMNPLHTRAGTILTPGLKFCTILAEVHKTMPCTNYYMYALGLIVLVKKTNEYTDTSMAICHCILANQNIPCIHTSRRLLYHKQELSIGQHACGYPYWRKIKLTLPIPPVWPVLIQLNIFTIYSNHSKLLHLNCSNFQIRSC
jgi:hypothetical protein